MRNRSQSTISAGERGGRERRDGGENKKTIEKQKEMGRAEGDEMHLVHLFKTVICPLFCLLCLLPSSFPGCCFKESGPGRHPANKSQPSLMSFREIHVRTKDQWKGHDTLYQIGHQYRPKELGQNLNIRMRNGSKAIGTQRQQVRPFITY